MSHCGISDVINVRLYDSQDELKTGARKKTCPDTSSDCELHYTRDRNVGYHEKYMNGGNTGVVPNSDPCQIITPLVLVGLGLGVGEGLGLCNQIAISTRGVIIWQGVKNGHNTGIFKKNSVCSSTHPHENSGATSVYIEKATYQMNSVSGGRERRSLWLIE